MVDDERLREALVELETLRAREARNHKETQALLKGLECIHSDLGRADSLRRLLRVIASSLGCDRALIIHSGETGSHVSLANAPELEGLAWERVGVPIDRGRRIVNVRALIQPGKDVPEPLRPYKSLLTEPIRITETDTAVICCLDERSGLFSKRESGLLKRFSNIASQALAGLDLEERNAFLAAVIAGSSSSVSIGEVVGGRLALTYVNKAFERLNGVSMPEALGRDETLFFSRNDEETEAFLDCIANRRPGSFRLRNRRRDGTDFTNEITVSPIQPEGGEIRSLVLTQTDITQQVIAETDRDEARNRLEAALSSTREGFLALGADGRILFANARFEEFVSMFRVEWGIGFEFTDIWSRYLMKSGVAEDVALQKAQDYLTRLLTRSRTLEVQIPDGRTVMVSERPIADGGAVIVASDVTPLKAAEQTLLQRAAAIENVQDGIAITDRKGRVTYANPSLVDLWGMEGEDDLLSRKWPSFYRSEDVESLLSGLSGADRQGTARAEIRLGADAEVVHQVTATLVADLGQVITVHDMTARLKDERSRAVLRERLQAAQRQEALGQMAAGLAHDFNNLLSAITGSANLIVEDQHSQPVHRKAAERIAAAGYRAAALVNKLLDLGASDQDREDLDLRDMLQETIDFARPSMRAGVRLSADLGSVPVRAFASHSDLLQMTLNLVMNALDALPPEGGEIRLQLEPNPALPDMQALSLGRIDAEYVYARIRVADTGSGIPADKIDNVFKSYFTTKGATGTGLGLAVVSSVVRANDGALVLTSEEGVGTVFDVYWPLNLSIGEETVQDKLDLPAGFLDGVPILVVDDEPGVARVMAGQLERFGAEVSALDDAQLALEVIAEDPEGWGCLITDYDMPGMNGGELIEKVAKVAPNLPRIVVTALARRLHDPRITHQTVDAVLAKPVEPSRLLNTVHAAIARKRP